MDVLEQWVVRGPADYTPPRRPNSVRRTSSIDMRWVDGWGSQMRLNGRARDLLTPADGDAPIVLAEDVLKVGAALDRTIEDIAALPARTGLRQLVGARAGNKLRAMLAEVVPDELRDGTPLYLLLDDLAGATLIGGFAFSQWPVEGNNPFVSSLQHTPSEPRRRMEGICTGFQPGASSLNPDGSSRFTHDVRHVAPLPVAQDPDGWHRFDEFEEVSMRRARRIDVWLDDVIRIDSMFQDSAKTPDGGRVAVHEYRLEATADPKSGALLSIHAEPRVLPYRECPMATANVHWLVDTPLSALRAEVLSRLKGTAGCTHLNDAMRALAEVPVLVQPLVAADC
jgi:hypothetical protein